MRLLLRNSPRASAGVEWPTIALAAVVYGAWAALTLAHAAIPPALLAILGGWLVAWRGSLQHETIHGHPTRWAWANAAIGWPPLSLWLPYEAYRRTHLEHHASEHLTHPRLDAVGRRGGAAPGAAARRGRPRPVRRSGDGRPAAAPTDRPEGGGRACARPGGGPGRTFPLTCYHIGLG